MEKWEEVFKGKIPTDKYTVSLNNGETRGLYIELESFKNRIVIDFGITSAVRMIEEGTLLDGGIYSEHELLKYKPNNFCNTIYKVENGQFGKFIKEQCNEMYDLLAMQHYLIITMNYCVDIVTEWEPTIEVIPIEDNSK